MKCSYPTATFGVALNKSGESTGEVWCGTVQDWSVRWSMVWHCTWLESEGKFVVALYKTGELGEVCCGTVQEWRVHKSGKHRRGFLWLYTTPEISSKACRGTVQHKTRRFRWDLVWHYTRLENTDEVWSATVQDWRLYVRFGVALCKTKSTGEVWCCTIQD